jgi:transglutaminase-like putative cysteine protease
VTRLQTREGKLSFFLLMLMLLSMTWSMEMAGWVEGLYLVEWTVLGGLASGFLMTRLRWPRGFGHLVSVALGATLVVAMMGRFAAPGLSWTDSVAVLGYQFDAWLRVTLSGQSSTDAVAFLLLVAVVGWWVGYASGWMVFGSHNVWQALGLTGGAMLLVAYGSPPEAAPFFVVYLLCALLLAVRLYVYTRQQSWDRRSARYDRDIVLSFLRDGGLLVLAVVLVVWTAPLLSSSESLGSVWLRLEGPWRAVGDEWSRLFSGVLGYPRGYENVPFGQQLALAGPIDLGEETVMWVTTEDGRYWRGMVYDRYTGRGWENADDETLVVPAGRDLPAEGHYESQWLVEQTVVLSRPGIGQVFQFGQPIAISLPTEIRYSLLEPGAGETPDPWAGKAAVSLVKTRVPVSSDRPYTVFSWTSDADVASLREAGRDYPEWISSRYLQLPQTLPDRVGKLAQELTSAYENDYDKAVAIRDYLRRTIVYREDIEAPPEDRDPIDYVLFDRQAGYCNYFASAMVVMARSVGIPARLVVGYVGGELDPDTGWYRVRERDTHAWVEVYFPVYGWVEFEPTASEAPIARPDYGGEEMTAEPSDTGVESHGELDQQRYREELIQEGTLPPSPSGAASGIVPAAVVLTVVPVAVAGFTVLLVRRRMGRTVSGVYGSYYASMCTYGRLMGVEGELCQTPYEYALALGSHIPQGARQVERITSLYVQERFSRRIEGPGHEGEAEEAWRRLRSLLRREIVRRIPRMVRSLCWRR